MHAVNLWQKAITMQPKVYSQSGVTKLGVVGFVVTKSIKQCWLDLSSTHQKALLFCHLSLPTPFGFAIQICHYRLGLPFEFALWVCPLGRQCHL